MKRIAILCLGLGLAACNQTAQQADLGPSAAVPVVAASAPAPVVMAPAPVAAAPVVAQDDMQSLPPIYTPLVDMHRKSQAKFDRDHAECRQLAAPQERAARDGMAQQQAGQAIAVAGALAGFIPVRGFNQAVNAARAGGAARGASATEDYALVVNNCMSRRNYVLLRA